MTACPSPWWSCGSGQQEFWLFLQQTDEGFDLSCFQLELNIPNVSVAVRRIVFWISELLEAVWITAVKSMPNSNVINSYIMYPTSLGSQDVTWKEIQPRAVPALPEDHCAFKGWCFLSQEHCGPGRFVAGVSVPSWDSRRHLSAPFPFPSFLWCPSRQALVKPRTLLMLGLLELFFASVFAEIFSCCVIMDTTWNNSPAPENNTHFCCAVFK